LKPLEPLVKHLLDIFEPFDLIPAPDAEVAEMQADWAGTWDESYTVSEDLLHRAEAVASIRQTRGSARPIEEKPTYELDADADVETMVKIDKERSARLTKTLAYLHSRGESTIIDSQATLLIIQVFRHCSA
jgi:endothelin-converting enzyme